MLFISIFSSCSEGKNENKDEREIHTLADSFATKFYCMKFKDAASFSDEKCQQHLKFLSSNINEEDINTIKKSAELPEFDIDKINVKNDNEANVSIELRNIYLLDSIGTKPVFVENATHTLLAKKINGVWKISEVIY